MTINQFKNFFKTRSRLQTGFSMLEAVVVVGVLLALAVGGFFAYGPITENAKIAKVKSSASEVHTAVLVANIDGDPNTNPQDVIDNWNNSTDKIHVEILEPAAKIAAMTTAEPTPSAEGDFCVQATNVETPRIKARTGACSDVVDGSGTNPGGTPVVPTPAPGPDTDGDGIPDATDPDIDGNGIPNTPLESYNTVKDAQATGAEVSYVNADGSTTTWNYKDKATYDHTHTPISPNQLESGHLDVINIQQDPANAGSIYVTLWTDGGLTTEMGAVGGHFGAYMHGDISCRDNWSGVITPRNAQSGTVLSGPYFGNFPGGNSGSLGFGCSWGETAVDFTLYPQRAIDWGNPGYSYFFTRDQIVHYTPAPVTQATPTWTTPPADYNAPSATIVSSSFNPSYWGNKSAASYTSSPLPYGFSISGADSNNQSNYKVEFTGGQNIGVAGLPTQTSNIGGMTWYATVLPGSEGFKTGTSLITAKVTNLTTNETSYKTWTTTITDAVIVPSNWYGGYFNNQSSTVGSTSNATFGGSITNGNASDFTVTFAGDNNNTINADVSATKTDTFQGMTWSADVTPRAGGFKSGTEHVTMTAKSNRTGAVVTKVFTLTIP